MNTRRHPFTLLALFVLLIAQVSVAHQDIAYRYDEAGRLILADYGSKQIVYQYDDAGNVLKREIRLAQVDAVGVVSEASGAVADADATSGTGNIPLASFTLQNTDAEVLDLSDIALSLDGGGLSHISQLNLVLDANGNAVSDVDEQILATLNSVPETGDVVFELLSAISLGAGDSLHFVVLADF